MIIPANEYFLQMKNISKSFPGVLALDDVSFNLKSGSAHALVGENGAGKSTLMKVLAGVYRVDSGKVIIDGKDVTIKNPREALGMGLSMIHQELNLIPYMTITENLFIGREITYGIVPVLNRKMMKLKTQEMLDGLGVDLNPDARINHLSIAGQQIVEIIKALFCNSNIIIMDEPTSAITEKEVEKLFEVIRKLIADNKSIVYISHKIDEIFNICDTVTILRDGRFVDSKPIEEMNKQKIISLMVGRELKNYFPKVDTKIGEIALEVKNLTKNGKFYDISFYVRKGEILGLAGLMGAGRTELMNAIFGVDKVDSGELFINGKKVNIKSPESAIKNKIAYVPEDRKLAGLNLKTSVKNNITIVNLLKYCVLKQIVNFKKENSAAIAQIKMLDIKTPSINKIVEALSGGNQQKVVVAKWLLCEPDILILDEPTRGIDIGAKTEIHRLMSVFAQEGKAVIMISSELPEIIGMSDRVVVLHEGRLTGEFNRDELTQEKIMACATEHYKEGV